MQTQNYCVFTIHSPCPHSNQIAGQLTSSSGVECGEWREMDERQGKCQLCVCVLCMAHSNHAAVHLVKVQQAYCQNLHLLLFFSPHLVFSMFNNQVILSGH